MLKWFTQALVVGIAVHCKNADVLLSQHVVLLYSTRTEYPVPPRMRKYYLGNSTSLLVDSRINLLIGGHKTPFFLSVNVSEIIF